ncbi:hypothetical protein [Consotaella salsifontis]|uniref:Uncharacterized protein n=1 Tax=Consotaella salsifontis TaxID=1365950 RepID=A0A1T4NX06_9HYPH|nr:hypothetical protein [Consotaella salsifontis]SJZ83745.1 hypothetical protein SAMN05428963_103232 [Consotaella salsifontis]
MDWYVYCTAPIDFGWSLLPAVADVASEFAKTEAAEMIDGYGEESDVGTATTFLADFEKARELAREHGWEGSYSDGAKPHVFWLPHEGQFIYGFVWKQIHSGHTFIISPFKLPWLEERQRVPAAEPGPQSDV